MDSQVQARIAAAWPSMLASLASGELIKDILARAGFNRDQVSAYKLSVPGAKAQWDEARAASADAFMDEALDSARSTMADPQATRVLIDTLKWAARIRNPAMYSDKSQLDVNVKTIDLTRIIQDANARLIAQQQGRIIDATPNNCEPVRALAHAQTAPELQPALDHTLLASIL